MAEGKLQWQCRRGMRELDELLARYLQSDFLKAGESEKAAFRSLLALPDPELVGYLLGGKVHENAEIADVVETIRGRT